VEDLIGWRSGRSDAVKEGELPATVVTAAAWNFATDSGTALFDRLENMPVKLSSIAERLAQGIRTSANEVYVLDVREDNGETITAYSKHLDKEVMLERQAVSAFLQGREIKPYQVLPSGKVVVVPYRIHEGRQKLISQQEYKQFYPKTWDYLLQNKPYLENREQGKMKCENWYSYEPLAKVLIWRHQGSAKRGFATLLEKSPTQSKLRSHFFRFRTDCSLVDCFLVL
jgi:hypothetical protein